MTGAKPHARAAARRSLWRRGAAGAALLLAGVGLAGCWGENFRWNQKLTVVVETPSGERSGSAVTRVETYVGMIFASGSRVSVSIAGEATAVEVAPNRYLFALIGEGTKNLALRAWGPGIAAQGTADQTRVIEGKRESITLTPDLYPMLVTFGNIADPASVQEVDPANLAATFGPGYALKSITLEITDEPVTEERVTNLIPWILTHRGRLKEIPVPTPWDYIATPVENLSRSNFIWGTP